MRKKEQSRSARKVECHFLAEMDSQIQVGNTATLDVTISREEIEAAAEKVAARGKAKVSADEKLVVEVLERKDLRVEGDRRQDVDLPPPGEPATVSFKVVGEQVGKGELSVQIRQGSIPLATLWLRPQIVAKPGARAPRLRQEFDLTAYPVGEPPLDELRIIETVNGSAVSYTFMLDLPSLKPKVRAQFRSEPLAGPRDAYVVGLMNEIGDSWIRSQEDGAQPHEAVQQFEDDIRAIGSKMFSQLLPYQMQELLWENRDRIKSVQVFSQEPFIPWELICLKDPKKGVVEEDNKFLGELGLLRWLYDGFPPSRLRIRRKRVRYLIGDFEEPLKLPQAQAEAAMLEGIFEAQAISARLKDLKAVLKAKNQFDLLHVCCHGEAAGEQASQAQVFVNGQLLDDKIDGEALRATTVEETIRLAEDGDEERPIVVLNACESARPNREFNGMGGFAHAFVKARAGAFIGTHWSVGDTPAFTFVEALYKAFAKKRSKPITLSEAVIEAREAARGEDDATWLAYVVYGHPHAQVSVD
jgi:hypothetical protein